MADLRAKVTGYTDQVLFSVPITKTYTMHNVPKSAILQACHDGFFFGICSMTALRDNVVDSQKIEIFRKLQLMKLNDQLKAWIEKYKQFMAQPQRDECTQKDLVNEYNLLIMQTPAEQVRKEVDSDIYKEANKYASKLQELHVK